MTNTMFLIKKNCEWPLTFDSKTLNKTVISRVLLRLRKSYKIMYR